jgi:hypothetical protein
MMATAVRQVVDSNTLQSPILRAYLSKSPNNFAVLTDYAAMEAYKGHTLASIFSSMEILANFPRQVIILKTTGVVCGLRGRLAGLTRRMIDERQTAGFKEYCRHLEDAKQGNVHLQRQLLDHGRAADTQLARMLADASTMPDVIGDVARTFSQAELKIIRTGAQFTEPLVTKLWSSIIEIAKSLYARHPRPPTMPRIEELHNTFLFRTAVCALFWALSWIAVGGPTNDVKTERIRNDLVDVNFAAFGTYFDGVLSMDKKLTEIYRQAVFVLRAISRERPSIRATANAQVQRT